MSLPIEVRSRIAAVTNLLGIVNSLSHSVSNRRFDPQSQRAAQATVLSILDRLRALVLELDSLVTTTPGLGAVPVPKPVACCTRAQTSSESYVASASCKCSSCSTSSSAETVVAQSGALQG